MRKILTIIIVTVATIFQSCSSGDESALSYFDFGSGKYKQPFRSLLKSEPDILVRSLHYAPFKWVAPDTVVLNKSFDIHFNEESIRSKASASISFADSLGRAIEGLSFFCNGAPVHNNTITVAADSTDKFMNLSIIVSPDFGEKEVSGLVYVSGAELDEVNAVSLQQKTNVIAVWRCEQTYGWPLMLWLLWLLIALLAVAIIVALGYFIWKAVPISAAAIGNCYRSICSAIQNKGKKSDSSQAGEQEKEEKKAKKKEKITDEERTDLYGYWVNEKLFRLYPGYVIPNGNQHKNPYGKTSRKLAQELGDPRPEIKFKDGYPVFDRDGGTKDGKPLFVVMPEGIGKYLKKEQLVGTGKKDRQRLHIEAFKAMSEKYGMDYDELQVFKGNSEPVDRLRKKWNCSENAVWKRCGNPHRIMRVLHECEDCKTIQLIPWLYHHVDHSGGIERISQLALME